MVKVDYYETATMRKTGKMKDGEIRGTFLVNINPEEVPEVSENLKGKTDREGNDLYELAVARRNKKVEQAIIDCKFKACDMVRELTGPEGVLVASIPEPDTTEEV